MDETSAHETNPKRDVRTRQQDRRVEGALQVYSTGVARLDEVLGGGIPRGSLAIVVGPPGSGKTTLACQIAFSAAQEGKQALVLTALSETSNKLISHLRTFRFFDPQVVGSRI